MNAKSLRIKAMMKEYKWSAPKLAQYSGVPLPSLKSILHGQSNNPRAKTLQALAKAFNCQVSDFDLPLDTPIEIRKHAVLDGIPILEKENEEELVKAAIRVVAEIANKKGIDLNGRDDLKEAYVSKLVAFAFENAIGDNTLEIDRVYASWLVGQEILNNSKNNTNST